MDTWYEIWGAKSASMITEKPTEDEALRFVARYIDTNGETGRAVVAHWALARNGERDEDFLLIAEGDALAELAMYTRAGAAD